MGAAALLRFTPVWTGSVNERVQKRRHWQPVKMTVTSTYSLSRGLIENFCPNTRLMGVRVLQVQPGWSSLAPARIGRRTRGEPRRFKVLGNDGIESDGKGDAALQNTLVDIMNLQVQFQKVKDAVSEESAKLTETAEQV
jgi:hypothetical protein